MKIINEKKNMTITAKLPNSCRYFEKKSISPMFFFLHTAHFYRYPWQAKGNKNSKLPLVMYPFLWPRQLKFEKKAIYFIFNSIDCHTETL